MNFLRHSTSRTYKFPTISGDLTPEKIRETVLNFNTEGSELAFELVSWISDLFPEEVEFLKVASLKLCLVEIFANIVKHDMLNVHGADAEMFSSAEWTGKEDEFTEKFKEANGLVSFVTLAIEDTGLTVSYTLSRPFPEFDEKWEKAKKNEPTDEELQTPCGFGTVLLASYFQDAELDSLKNKICYYRDRKKVEAEKTEESN